MFTDNQSAYLSRHLAQNNVVLFLGAGFARSAENRLGNPLPLASELAEDLWDYLGYEGQYNGEDLSLLYEAALTAPGGYDRLRPFLTDRLLCSQVPRWYNALSRIFWYRVYTTNVDDLVEQVYDRVADVPHLDRVISPAPDVPERDDFLDTIQYVKLHGSLIDLDNDRSLSDLTFSLSDYAERGGEFDLLYSKFATDYATRPTVFIGSNLNESLLWQHVVLRERKTVDRERRPKSFLVVPDISPARADALDQYNVEPVIGNAEEFLSWVSDIQEHYPSRGEVLLELNPSLAFALDTIKAGVGRSNEPRIKRFFESFDRVQIQDPPSDHRPLYLLGATPTWDDLAAGFDAEREINSEVTDIVRAAADDAGELCVIVLTGSAGCGKSTVLRRVALTLQAEGRHIYLTNSEDLPRGSDVDAVLDVIPEPAILAFDNAEISTTYIRHYIEELSDHTPGPTLVIALRSNAFERVREEYSAIVDVTEVPVPNLTRNDIDALIDVLDENNLLGELRDMSHSERVHEFEEVAQKQLLVAMREATLGEDFDKIIADEFRELTPREAKVLYLCVALATAEGYRLTEQQFVACASVPSGDALDILHRNLRNIVLRSGSRDEHLVARHRYIAEEVVENSASRSLLGDAYVRLLKVLAKSIAKHGRNHRDFRLYLEVVNHRSIYRHFSEKVKEARDIYEEIADFFSDDYHFWLQYGTLELMYGNLKFASNYIAQAESIAPYDNYVRTAKGHLLMKRAVHSDDEQKAVTLRNEGEEILDEQIRSEEDDRPHPYHIKISQTLAWIHEWVYEKDRHREALEDLYEEAERAREEHPRSADIRQLYEDVQREYMMLAATEGG